MLSSIGTLRRAQRRDIGTALRSYSKLATRNSRGKKEFADEQLSKCKPKLAIPGARLELIRSYLDNSSKQEIDLLHTG